MGLQLRPSSTFTVRVCFAVLAVLALVAPADGQTSSLLEKPLGKSTLDKPTLGESALGKSGLGKSALEKSALGGSKFGDAGDLFPNVELGNLVQSKEAPAQWSASYTAAAGKGQIKIEVQTGRSWHVYSTTQPAGGPKPTKFSIDTKGIVLAGDFQPSEPPEKSVSAAYPGLTIEEHSGNVRWTAPITLPANFAGNIQVSVKALACQSSGACMPLSETLVATRGNRTEGTTLVQTTSSAVIAKSDGKPKVFRDEGYVVTWSMGVSNAIAPGERGHLVFAAKPDAKYHVYHGVVDDAKSATNFIVTKKAGLRIGGPTTRQPVIEKSLLPEIPGLPPVPPQKFHASNVKWELPIEVPEGTKSGSYVVEGFVGYQACTDTGCREPKAISFRATVKVDATSDPQIRPIDVATVKYITAMDAVGESSWADPIDQPGTGDSPIVSPEIEADVAPTAAPLVNNDTDTPQDGTSDDSADAASAVQVVGNQPKISFGLLLVMSLGGGLILNLMPCVLPVVGLKIMSFVQQAGEDRKRIFALNFAYVAGILTVFGVLTLLAVFASFSWGQQFTYFPVRLGLTILIFALALSYLGVWELPTPGIATGNKSQQLQDREGLSGAFFKGAFATVLATPCSGPLLGVVLGYTITLKPIETATVMMTVGIGMALPYVLLGLIPSAVRLLPKPGNWMVTLKEFMAFLFLGTVAFFFNQFADGEKLAVFVTLIGVWFGCWAIGKVPPYESIEKHFKGWAFGIASAALIGWFSFSALSDETVVVAETETGVELIHDKHLTWEKYSEPRLRELQAAGKTVMLDFTASWCTNCFFNKKVALDTSATRNALAEIDGVAMLAVWTDDNEKEIKSKLQELESNSIPVLAIYPGVNPKQPIVLRDLVSQSSVLEALEQAGPSIKDAEQISVSQVRNSNPTAGLGSRR